MPTYRYLRRSTGETWSEIRKIANRLDGVDGEEVILLLAAPKQADPTLSTKRLHDFDDKVLSRIRKEVPGAKI